MVGTVAAPAGAAGGEAPPAGNAFVGNIARLGLMYLAMSWFTSKKSTGTVTWARCHCCIFH